MQRVVADLIAADILDNPAFSDRAFSEASDASCLVVVGGDLALDRIGSPAGSLIRLPPVQRFQNEADALNWLRGQASAAALKSADAARPASPCRKSFGQGQGRVSGISNMSVQRNTFPPKVPCAWGIRWSAGAFQTG